MSWGAIGAIAECGGHAARVANVLGFHGGTEAVECGAVVRLKYFEVRRITVVRGNDFARTFDRKSNAVIGVRRGQS